MSRLESLVRAAGALTLALAAFGCTGVDQMTSKQREGVELRRYCEQHPEDDVKCVGFHGWR